MSKIVNGIRKSTADTEVLIKSVGFRVPPRNSTRWNSQFYMLRKYLEALQKDPILQTKLSACKRHGKLLPLQVEMLKELIILLGPFQQATDVLQRDKETVGLVIPAYLDMLNKCTMDPLKNPDCVLIQNCRGTAEGLRHSLVERLGSVMENTYFLLGKE